MCRPPPAANCSTRRFAVGAVHLERITFKPFEHSASEDLYMRQLHYERRRAAGDSVWPMGGWDAPLQRMASAFDALGGTVIQPASVARVVVRDGAVHGVELADGSALEADEVGKLLADNRNRACWLGYWIAAKEPVIAGSEREMSSIFPTPRTGLPWFTLNFTGYYPGVSPKGEYRTCFGATFDATAHSGDRASWAPCARTPSCAAWTACT